MFATIKYHVAVVAVMFLSLIFLAACGAADGESDVQNENSEVAQGNPVPIILDRISGSACSQLPYEICLVAATGASVDLRAELGKFLSDPVLVRQMQKSERIQFVSHLIKDYPLPELWLRLNSGSSEDIGGVGLLVKLHIEMYFITKELEQNLSHVDWGWVVEHEQVITTAAEKCRSQIEKRDVGLYICDQLDTTVNYAKIWGGAKHNIEFQKESIPQIRSLVKYFEQKINGLFEFVQETVRNTE